MLPHQWTGIRLDLAPQSQPQTICSHQFVPVETPGDLSPQVAMHEVSWIKVQPLEN